jgi:hypothetical protein
MKGKNRKEIWNENWNRWFEKVVKEFLENWNKNNKG